ncbi:MAG: hypothetical protein C5B52_01470 [Bacteroidetes bacterium]|nr:MAG: hypothetical protein C5B52_01470 [Bacteroidota bacterium]
MLYKFLVLTSLIILGTSNKYPENIRVNTKHSDDENSFLLEYTGTLAGYMNLSVGAQVAMDTTIGFRYDITFQNGTSVISHDAFFYKFSNPNQLTKYNYLTHQSSLINPGKTPKSEDLNVVGKENIDTFVCMHLRKTNDREQQDYWMSKSVPGFSQLTKILKGIDPNLAMMAIDQTLFKWGGLVRARVINVANAGSTTTFNLNLIEEQTGLVFTDKDFEVPSN